MLLPTDTVCITKSGKKRKTKNIAIKNPPPIPNNIDDSTPIKNIKQEIDIEINNDTETKPSKSKRKIEIPIENDLEIKKMADLINIKEEPVDFLDIVAVGIETDEVNEANNDDMNLLNEVNNGLNLKFEAEEVDFPIKCEVEDEPDEAYYEISENNTMQTDFSINVVEEDDSSKR